MRQPTTLGFLAACAAVLAVACGGTSTPPPPPPPPSSATLVLAGRGDLVPFVADKLRARFGASALPVALAAAPAGQTATTDAIASAAPPGTLVQEAGVDEDDLLKLHAQTVLSLHGDQLRRHRLAGGSLAPIDELTLPADDDAVYRSQLGLHLKDDGSRAIVLDEAWRAGDWLGKCPSDVCATIGLIALQPTQPRLRVQPVSIGAELVPGDALVIDGRLVGSRRVGRHLVLVTVYVPALAIDALPPAATTAEREAVLARLTAGDLLPTVRIGDADPKPLVDETDCYVQPGNASTAVEVATITVLDLDARDLAPRSRCFVGGTEAMYMTPDALVLGTTRWSYAIVGTGVVYPDRMQTDLHRFALADGEVRYVASGTVDGHLGWDATRKSTRLSAWQGDLRVLSYTGAVGWSTEPGNGTPPSPAQLTVLREEGGVLREVARLPNARHPEPIGKPEEQLYGVRFVGTRAYAVTFRRVDPLYVLDLTDPVDPRMAGVLEVPGFSNDLFDLGDGWLLGVGRDADAQGRVNGVGLFLFDVRDPAQPRRQTAFSLGNAESWTALDASPHGLNLWRQGNSARAALPLAMPVEGLARAVLQRIDVDTATGTMALRAPLAAPDDAEPWPDVSRDRALVLGEQVLHLRTDGAVRLYDW